MSERAMHLKYLCVNWRYDIYIYVENVFSRPGGTGGGMGLVMDYFYVPPRYTTTTYCCYYYTTSSILLPVYYVHRSTHLCTVQY